MDEVPPEIAETLIADLMDDLDDPQSYFDVNSNNIFDDLLKWGGLYSLYQNAWAAGPCE